MKWCGHTFIKKYIDQLYINVERMYELTQAMETESKSHEEYKGQQEASMGKLIII